MTGHALPPPAQVMSGPTMRGIGNGRQLIQSFRAAKTLSWPSSPPFLTQMNSNHQLWNPPLNFREQNKMVIYKAPQAPALYRDKRLKSASPNT